MSLYNEFPLAVKFIGDSIAVITDKALRFYNSEFEEISAYSFSSQSPGGFVFSDTYVMLYFEKNTIGSKNEIKLYSKNGEFLFSSMLSGKVNSLDINGEYAILYTNDLVHRINISDKTLVSSKIDTGAEKAMLQSDSTVLVCYKNYARLLDFSGLEESYLSSLSEK